jgi:hypothetical protein
MPKGSIAIVAEISRLFSWKKDIFSAYVLILDEVWTDQTTKPKNKGKMSSSS